MTMHLFGTVLTAEAVAANNRGENEGTVSTLQKIIRNGEVFSTVSAEATTSVRARGGLLLTADVVLAEAVGFDLLVVPGGVTTRIEDDQDVVAWIGSRATEAEVVAAVCTGAFPLALAGLLDGRVATTHWEDLAELRRRFPAVSVVDEVRYVDEGPVATSAGVSAGIDLALHLVARLHDDELAGSTARQMDYPWLRSGVHAVIPSP